MSVDYVDREQRVAAFTRGCELKAQANALFKAQAFAGARAKYEEALELLPWTPPFIDHDAHHKPPASHIRYHKERTTTLSNCAEACLRVGDAESALFYATCALDSDVVTSKTAARMLNTRGGLAF